MLTQDGNAIRNRLAEKQAEHCRIFSNTRRVLILWALMEGEMSVGEIADEVGTTLQNISQHLHLMKDSRLVSSRRSGQTILYRLNQDELAHHCQQLLSSRTVLEETSDPPEPQLESEGQPNQR